MNRKISISALALSALVFLTACHPKVEPSSDLDKQMNCSQLKSEIQHASDVRGKIEKARGFSVRNVGLALLFWPGVVINEVTGESAESKANARIAHLKNIYAQQCTKDECNDLVVSTTQNNKKTAS